MKKTFLILIVVTLLSPSLLAQKKNIPDRELVGLKGPVKTVRLEIAEIKQREGKSEEGRRRLISTVSTCL